jgi:hypothetical protein
MLVFVPLFRNRPIFLTSYRKICCLPFFRSLFPFGSDASVEEGDANYRPYSTSNQLEYLQDRFSVLALQIRGALARTKEEMKDAGALKEDAYNPDYGRTTSAGAGRRELLAKRKVCFFFSRLLI